MTTKRRGSWFDRDCVADIGGSMGDIHPAAQAPAMVGEPLAAAPETALPPNLFSLAAPAPQQQQTVCRPPRRQKQRLQQKQKKHTMTTTRTFAGGGLWTDQPQDAFALMMASSRQMCKQEQEQRKFRELLSSMALLGQNSQSSSSSFCYFCAQHGRTSVPAVARCTFCEKPLCSAPSCSCACADCGNLFCQACATQEFALFPAGHPTPHRITLTPHASHGGGKQLTLHVFVW